MDVASSIPFVILGIVIIFAAAAAVNKYQDVKQRNACNFYYDYIQSGKQLMSEHSDAVWRAKEVAKILKDQSLNDRKKLAQIGDCDDLVKLSEAITIFVADTNLTRRNYDRYDRWSFGHAQSTFDYWWNTRASISRMMGSIENIKQRQYA